jgi:hypothetical protein
MMRTQEVGMQSLGEIVEKQKRQKRIQQKIRHVEKQLKLRKRSSFAIQHLDKVIKQPHRLQKRSAYTCGNPNCVMCGNPRKFFGESTIQEQSFKQTERWYEDSDQNQETQESYGGSCGTA